MGCTNEKSKGKSRFFSAINRQDRNNNENEDNPNNLHILSGIKSASKNMNSNEANIQEQNVLSRIIAEEGFEEKIKHIEKVFEQLLESNDNRYDMCSVSDPQLNDFLLSHKNNSLIIDSPIPLSSTPDIPGEQISKQILDSQFQILRTHIINDVLKAEYILLSQQTPINSPKPQIFFRRGQIPQKILEESDNSLKHWTIDVSQERIAIPKEELNDTTNNTNNLAKNTTNNQNNSNFGQNQGNTPKQLIDINTQQSQQRAKRITLQATHFDAEEELIPQSAYYSKKNNSSLKGVLPRQSLLRANSHSSFTDKAKQRISMSDVKRTYSPSNAGTYYNRHPIIGGSGSQLPSTKEYGGDIHARSTNLNEITLQEIDQDFKDNSNRLQCQFSLFALKSIEEKNE